MSITKLAERYIMEHPSIKDCLKKGLVNYSSLSRQIASDLNLNPRKNFDAILIACRRLKRKLKKGGDFEEIILKILKQSKIEIKNKNLAEITIKSPKEIETTPGTYAYVCSLFWENNINIVETLSCWTDSIFLIKEEDVGKAINLLRF